jgi:hypothetical protein
MVKRRKACAAAEFSSFASKVSLLTERDGYSLTYGSLSLLAVAIRIDKEFGTDFRAALRQRGEPVVFVCEIPMGLLEDDALDRLLAALCQAHSSTGERRTLSLPVGVHFSIHCPLPSKAIVSHHRPHHVIDTVYGKHIGGLQASKRASDSQ